MKKHLWLENSEDIQRQYIDAQAVFTAWEAAKNNATEVRGGMIWRNQNGTDYLIRTSPSGSQKSLGPRSGETEVMFTKFVERKKQATGRLASLRESMERHQRMNRALHVGRTPPIVVNILNRLADSGLADHFTVIGTHALYAYEAATGVRIGESNALATQDVDLLWDTRKKVSFLSRMDLLGTSFLGLLRKVDPTFEIHPEQHYTAVNDKGFEVDVIQREPKDDDLHPWRMTNRDEDEDEIYAVFAKRAGILLEGERFSRMVVSSTGQMARMRTISPVLFVEFKRWLAGQEDRDPLKRQRDMLQADLVEELVKEYLPNVS